MKFNTRKLFILLTVFSVAMLFSQSAWAMWVVEQQQTMGNGMKMKSIMTFGDYALRTDMPSQGMSTIMNFKNQKVYMIQHAQKMYMEMSMEAMKKQVSQAIKSNGQNSDVIATKMTGEHKTIAGYDCEKIIMMKNGKKVGEIWIAKKLDGQKIMKVYKQFFNLTGAQEAGNNDAILKGMKESIDKGFPMMSSIKDDKGVENKSEVVKIDKKKNDDSLFLPPKGYKKIEMPAMPGGMP